MDGSNLIMPKGCVPVDQTERRSLLAIPLIVLVAVLVALAGSQGGYEAFGVPLFALCLAIAFLIQWIAFIPAYAQQTEAFFDLTGSLTYLTVVWVSLLLRPGVDARSILLVALISVWAIRLGTFLFRRIRAAGSDERFDEIKPSLPRFLTVWTIQGLWVSLTLAAALAAITSSRSINLGIYGVIGTMIWIMGFVIEVIADQQKNRFRTVTENSGKFINTGLWAWSRHPNYFGEIILWIGIAIIAVPVLQGWQWLTLISPLFVILLLTRVSGIPMLERRADEKWGGDPDYEQYKAQTPVLIPRPPSGQKE
jgi:steroid 5-alpha reductase family enzyme